jgi:hypothetical protein
LDEAECGQVDAAADFGGGIFLAAGDGKGDGQQQEGEGAAESVHGPHLSA